MTTDKLLAIRFLVLFSALTFLLLASSIGPVTLVIGNVCELVSDIDKFQNNYDSIHFCGLTV